MVGCNSKEEHRGEAGDESESNQEVGDDLSLDSRLDLLAVECRTQTKSELLHVDRDQCESGNDRIVLRLHPPAGESVHGATVLAKVGEQFWKKAVETGDSFPVQHAVALLFGLGAGQEVYSLTVRRPSGKEAVLEKLAKRQDHKMTP